MEEIFESSLLSKLYAIRNDGFRRKFIRNKGKSEQIEKADLKQSRLEELISNIADNSNDRKEIRQALDDLNIALVDEMCFWNEQFYKLGFTDACGVRAEISKNQKEHLMKDQQNFLEMYRDAFIDYFENFKKEDLHKRNEYNEILEEIREIKQKYPRVREFIEDDKWQDLSAEEQKAYWEFKGLDETLVILETESAFRLGVKSEFFN